MARSVACTIVARNYLAQARAWAESIRRFDRETELVVLLADEPFGMSWREESDFAVLGLAEIGVPELEAFAFRYDVTELCTAAKPWLLQTLLERHEPEVLYYFDPDTLLFGPLGELEPFVHGADLALTPHLLGTGTERIRDIELAVLRSGTFNLGFLALANTTTTEGFLEWWKERLELDCVIAVEEGLFVDQKWIDLAAAALPRVSIIRHPGANVAYWNLHERRLGRSGDTYRAGGEPLLFFHFSGYDPGNPEQISKHLPNLRLTDYPEARPLFYDYCERLARHGFTEASRIPYRLGYFSDGTPISLFFRRTFAQAERQGIASWRSPRTIVNRDSFAIWAVSTPPMSEIPPVSAHILAGRLDLQAEFPGALADPVGESARRFREWFVEHAASEFDFPGAWVRFSELMRRRDHLNGGPPSTGSELTVPPGSKAVSWLLAKAVDDQNVRAATDIVSFSHTLFKLAQGCVRDDDRRALGHWLDSRPLDRAFDFYANRTDVHARFRHFWRVRERRDLVLWLTRESPLSADDLALFEAFLAWNPERAVVASCQKNSRLRAPLLRIDIRSEWRTIRSALDGGASLDDLRSLPRAEPPRAPGANFVGFYDSLSGVGEAARSTLESARRADVTMAVETLLALPTADTPYAHRHDPLSFPISIFNGNAENVVRGPGKHLANALADTYRIGVWFWELEHFPAAFRSAFDRVEELWARSRFMERSFRAITPKPVTYLPLGVSEPRRENGASREVFGFRPGQTVFLTICDAFSMPERKNPMGAIDAFRRARLPFDAARLVVLVNNAEPEVLRDLVARGGDANVLILPGPLPERDFGLLRASADAVVSLHRSEGFGLPLAEAMLLGKPVVATGYGGNMDFTTPDTAFVVDYELVRLRKKVGPYPAEAVWAEPNLSAAAEAMRQIVLDPASARERAARGRKHLLEHHGHDAVGRILRQRLEEILEIGWFNDSPGFAPASRKSAN